MKTLGWGSERERRAPKDAFNAPGTQRQCTTGTIPALETVLCPWLPRPAWYVSCCSRRSGPRTSSNTLYKGAPHASQQCGCRHANQTTGTWEALWSVCAISNRTEIGSPSLALPSEPTSNLGQGSEGHAKYVPRQCHVKLTIQNRATQKASRCLI